MEPLDPEPKKTRNDSKMERMVSRNPDGTKRMVGGGTILLLEGDQNFQAIGETKGGRLYWF